MPPEITAAIIAASVSVFASVITLVIGLRGIKIEREKLRNDRERLQAELRNVAEQSRLATAEIAKLKAEAAKFSTETDEIRIRKLRAERDEVSNLLQIFERAFFYGPLPCMEPIAMFRAIQQTRKSLQISGATLIHNNEIAEHFKQVRDILRTVEYEIEKRFPAIIDLSDKLKDEPLTTERQRQAIAKLGSEFGEAIQLIMGCRSDVDKHLDEVRSYLHRLDTQFS